MYNTYFMMRCSHFFNVFFSNFFLFFNFQVTPTFNVIILRLHIHFIFIFLVYKKSVIVAEPSVNKMNILSNQCKHFKIPIGYLFTYCLEHRKQITVSTKIKCKKLYCMILCGCFGSYCKMPGGELISV